MEHLYSALFAWLQAHGLHGVFAFMLVESGGLPVPTELGFITAQGLMDAGLCGYWEAFLWINAGHLVGAGISYHLGRAGDSAVARYLAHKQGVMDAREKMQRWFVRYGPLAVLFGRLIGQVRPWASFVAGLARVSPGVFWLWTVLGTLVFTAITMWITEVGWAFWVAHPRLRTPLIVGMFVVFYGLPIYKGLERLIAHLRRRKALEADDV